jgi:hypothetical protein
MSADAITWRIGTYDGGERPLDRVQVTRLAAKHGLEVEALERLSHGLAVALDPRRHLGRDELKSLQRDKAIEEIGDAVRDIEAGERKFRAARKRLADIHFVDEFAHLGRPNPAIAQGQKFDDAMSSIESFKQYVAVMARAGMVSLRPIADKRRARDERRRIVCNFLFRFWEEAGRNVSYTTDPITSERCGPLVEFVRDVVECISDPPGRLSGEAIKGEIEYFRKRRDTRAAARRQVVRSVQS